MINKELAKSLGLDNKTQDQIEQLHDIRDEIREEIRDALAGEDLVRVKMLVSSLVIVNYTLQDMWGFPRNKDKHQEETYKYE